ncbi:MAG: DUF6531 domain-containing protein, partial [Anaerovoracaceae bacterium]
VKGYDYREFLKRLGEKDSYSYLDLELPNANVRVEKSQGNAYYSQTDAELPNETMPISFSRTYNSQSAMKGAFGLGFSHNYDISLLSPGMNTATEFETAIVKDDSGSIITFQKEVGGKFVSDKGMYYSLEKIKETDADKGKGTYRMLSKDNLKYFFNIEGILVREEDSNGNFSTLEYDKDTGKLLDIVAQSGRKIQLSYGTGDSKDLVSKVTAMDKNGLELGKVEYTYNNRKLVKITKVSKTAGVANTENVLTYSDSTDTSMLTGIKDALGNIYSIAYNGVGKTAKAIKLTYPDGTNLRLAYNGNNTETTTQKYINNTFLSSAKDLFESSFGNQIESTDEAGNKSAFTYMDCLTESTATSSEYAAIESGTLKKYHETKVSKTAYNTNTENVDQELGEDGSQTDFVYDTAGDNIYTDDLPDELIETDADGKIVSAEKLTYDSRGNELTSKDSVSGEENINVYCTASDFGGTFLGEIKKETLKGEDGLTTVTDYSYSIDGGGNRTDMVTVAAAGVSNTTITTTDPLGNQIYLKDASGDITENFYDDFGRLTKTIRKIGEKTETSTKTYNANGSLIREVSPTGIVSTYSYDKMNKVVSTTIAKGSSSKTTQTIRSYLPKVTINTGMGYVSVANPYVTKEYIKGDSRPVSETYIDRLGRTVREKSGGIYTDYTYDKQGKVLTAYKIGQSEKAANAGLLTLNVYDENGNQTDTVINPSYDIGSKSLKVSTSSIHTKSIYNASGKEIERIDAMGNITRMDYNINGELTKLTGPKIGEDKEGKALANSMEFAYNQLVSGNTNLVKNTKTDANGNISIEEINALGQTIKIADLGDNKAGTAAISTAYEYDKDGNKIKETEAKGNFRTFSYDNKKHLIKSEYFDEKGDKKLSTRYSYDLYDNVTK